MAKRGVLEHEKNLALADALEISECFSLGVLEAFWHWVAKYRPHGDITGIKATLFARSIRYSGNAEVLLRSLIGCGWIDETPDGRLLVHDWSEHADNAVHQLLKDRGEMFADNIPPYSRNKSRKQKKAQDSSHHPPEEITFSDPEEGILQDSCKNLQSTCNSQIPEPEPEEEYISRPVTTAVAPVVKMPFRPSALDHPEIPTAKQFMEKYVTLTDVPYSEDDERRTFFAFGALDLENKVEAYNFIEEYAATRNLYSSPQNYLSHGPWRRRSRSGLRTQQISEIPVRAPVVCARGLDYEEIA